MMRGAEFDEMSFKLMEKYKDDFPNADVEAVMQRIMQRMVKLKVDMRRDFREKDPHCTGFVPNKSVFFAVLDRYKVMEGLNDHEKLTLLRKFVPHHHLDTHQDTPVEYVYMCDMLSFMYSCDLERSSKKFIGRSTAGPEGVGGEGEGGSAPEDEPIVRRRRRSVLGHARPEDFVMLLSLIEVPWR